MNPFHNYKISSKFTIKLSAIKPKKIPSSTHKRLTKTLYCIAYKTEEGWKAHINTRGIEGYEDLTILDFTEQSFELKNRNDVFYHEKDKTNHYVRIIRNDMDAYLSPGLPEVYCTLCNGDCFSGHIVKINGIPQFDMLRYKGTRGECEHFLTRSNNKEKDEEE